LRNKKLQVKNSPKRCWHDYKNAIPVGNVYHICPLCKELLDPMEWFFMNQFEFIDVGSHRCKIERIEQPDKGQIKISLQDLRTILGGDFHMFETETLSNCWCYKCDAKKGKSKIVKFRVFLNNVNDVVLRGFCGGCGSRVDRYVETSEVRKYIKIINRLRKDAKKSGKKVLTRQNYLKGYKERKLIST
jgi:hypothetical protein